MPPTIKTFSEGAGKVVVSVLGTLVVAIVIGWFTFGHTTENRVTELEAESKASKEMIASIAKTTNEIKELNTTMSILLARHDEKLKDHDRRLDKIE